MDQAMSTDDLQGAVGHEQNEIQEEQQCYWDSFPTEIIIYIFKYLSHTDLHLVREVCKRWLNITCLPGIMKNTKLIICDENVATIAKCLQDDEEFCTRMNYDTVEVCRLAITSDLHFILKSLGKNIRQIHLNDSPVFNLLNNCLPQLEALMVSNRSQEHSDIDINFSRFKNFKALDIRRYNMPEFISTPLIRNLMADTSLKIETVSFFVYPDQEQLIIDTLRFHSHSLKNLRLLLCWNPEMIQQWCQVFATFRQLNTLQLCGWTKDLLKRLIECLPIDINLQMCYIPDPAIDNLTLKLIIRKWPQTLKHMQISNCKNITDDAVKDLGILKSNLKTLIMLQCIHITPKGLLEGLAKNGNTTLKKLRLNNLHSRDTITMIALATRFPNLTYLSLENCVRCVDDETLAAIIANQPKLQHLILANCRLITDKGLLGFGLNPAPISKLKYLQTLNLSGCEELTDAIFLNRSKFYNLRTLNLANCKKITSMGIKEVVSNFPALESLNIKCCHHDRNEGIISYIFRGLPRLKSLDV